MQLASRRQGDWQLPHLIREGCVLPDALLLGAPEALPEVALLVDEAAEADRARGHNLRIAAAVQDRRCRGLRPPDEPEDPGAALLTEGPLDP